ncbi:hypothetical protein NDA13_003613 [Ustilago tritici]|nr:hypothetical protein NDA13_003613 [Ustilago tritici]
MVESASHLYFATHDLGSFCNHFDLGKQMRACINFFIAIKDSNIKQILDLKFEGNKPSTSGDADSVPYYHASNDGLHSTQDAMSANSEAQLTKASHKPLCSQEATPTATPELTQLTNRHLKVLSTLNDKLKWDERELSAVVCLKPEIYWKG